MPLAATSMTEKKSLNFDFLDEKPKETGGAIDAPVVVPSAPETDKIGFFPYFKECFLNFSKFSKQHLVTKSPKYLWLAIWVIGLGSATGNLTSSDSTGWSEVWTIAVFGGILAGAIAYYIAGWFYNVRVQWSKGQGGIDTARNIYIFSSLPIAVTSIASLLFNQLSYGSDYFTSYSTDASSVDLIFGLLSFAAIIYSIVISYRAVREVMHAEKRRAIGWFVVAPAIFYFVAFFGAALT